MKVGADWTRSFLESHLTLIFVGLLAVAAVQKFNILSGNGGGAEIELTYVPKTLMFLHGLNPYSTNISAAPYPPFLFAVLASIVVVAERHRRRGGKEGKHGSQRRERLAHIPPR